MNEAFPKVGLSERRDLDRVVDIVRQHAVRLVRKELAKSGPGQDREAEQACQKAIDAWIEAAKEKLMLNVSINGMSYADNVDGTEPFDAALSQRVQQLSERADTLTADAIAARKTIPAERAALIKTRTEAMDRVASLRHRKQRAVQEEFTRVLTESAEAMSREEPTLERSDQIAASLHDAVNDIEKLTVSLLEQTSAANEQANFVKRLRIMSASYS